jgi:hypothetical protein
MEDGMARAEVRFPPDRDNRAAMARLLLNEGLELLEMASMPASLEEVFLKLTTEERLGEHQG